jgi:Spy/CpxP family protein refolding chaperone
MKMFVATLAAMFLLAAFSGIVTAQEIERETEAQPLQQMPMMQGMMGRGMMGEQAGMMQQGGVAGQMPMMGGMICPMCGRMMGGGMMQGGMIGHMPMMHGMMGRGMMGWMHGMFTPQMLLFWAGELNLEEEQIKSIQMVGFDLQKEIIQKNADRSIASVELNALLGQDEIDLQQAQQKIQQIATLGGKLRVAQIKAFINTKEVLTEEQRAKLKELMIKQSAMYTPQKAATQKGKQAGRKLMR